MTEELEARGTWAVGGIEARVGPTSTK